MTPFSIELAIEKIADKHSKENFLEVYANLNFINY